MNGPAAQRLALHAGWLVRLRWLACGGQLATIAVATLLFQVRLPLGPLGLVIVAVAASNALFQFGWRHVASIDRDMRQPDWDDLLLTALMTLDIAALTALLHFTGGPQNPFAVFYFVNLALAAVILPARRAWLLLGVALIGWSSLFLHFIPLAALREAQPIAAWPGAPQVALQSQGGFVALVLCASVVVYFVTYVTRELRAREAELRTADQQRARGQKLEALATLAAGAAHELATPLSTIAVVAKELSRHLENVPVPETVREDVALIRGELDRCRTILDRMSASAGQAVGEEAALVSPLQLIDEILDGVRRRARVEVSIEPEAESVRLRVPLQAVALALRGVVRNALDATENVGDHVAVRLVVAREPNGVRCEVRDAGPGMPPDVLARAGEPFFTTKEPGRGMGLGVFLCRSVVERLGGTLELHSPPGEGVTATVRLPREA